MKKLIFTTLILISFCGFSQNMNQKVMDSKKNIEILLGYCNRQGFSICPFDSAYQAGYPSYTPDAAVLEEIAPLLPEITITIVMGTWCGDSKDQVPRFYKILDALQFDESKVSLICVDRDKKAGFVSLEDMNIQLVPTFIFFRNGKELCRIVETPSESLEKDMLRVLSVQ
ncbi:MAG: thioredoxin family protein [Lentimicrobiaceae bacterium]|jgi:thiol-disulfide isomerase/thioredoxin|nr:thioredoxin family protein [Lentimicrobiaceae bacterium]